MIASPAGLSGAPPGGGPCRVTQPTTRSVPAPVLAHPTAPPRIPLRSLLPTHRGRGCAVGGFAETTARYRGIGSGGFTATATADRGVLGTAGITADACGESEGFAGRGSQVVAAAADRGVEVVGEVVCAAGDGGVLCPSLNRGVYLGRVRAGRGSLQGLWARSLPAPRQGVVS
jgi:hypothetical protein